MDDIIPRGYQNLLRQIKRRIREAQYQALKKVNRELIILYWDIGKIIVEQQKKEKWGKSTVERLAMDIRIEFPKIRGFSSRNLWRMRNLYLTYRMDAKLQQLVTEVSWSHNLLIMEKCKDPQQREFYLRVSSKYGWTKNVLLHQIDNQTYEKTLLGQHNFSGTLPPEIRDQAKLAIKDEYTYDFLELGDRHSEQQLEEAILKKIGPFLREMGGMFAFIGNQYRIEIEDQEYFIDILLYHRLLKSLVALELKIGAFQPEYVGKMQFYLEALDSQVRVQGENPSIGIILCRTKKKFIVEYALRTTNKPVGVATYRVVSRLPMEFKGHLPEPAQVAQLLESIGNEGQVSHDTEKSVSEKKIPEKSPPKSEKKYHKLKRYIQRKGKITNKEYQQLCSIKQRQATQDLTKFCQEGILRKIGTRGRGTHYVLANS